MVVGTQHDVELGGIALRLAPNGWRRRPAPVRGARIATGDYGYGDLSVWQRWHQFCWNGGLGATKWVDDAMFDEGVGLDTTVADQVSLSRDLKPSVNTNLKARDLGRPRKFMEWTNPSGARRLYCVSMPWPSDDYGSTVYKYQDWDDTWVVEKTFGANWKAMSLVKHSKEFAIGFRNGKIRRTETPNSPNSWKTTGTPKKAKGLPVAQMMRFNKRLYVAYKDFIYRRKFNWKVDGKTVFYECHTGAPVVAMEIHQGFLYWGTKNGKLFRTDGNNSFNIWTFDGGTRINALRSFDGRLFVSTYEFTDDDDLGVNAIYQFTGSAVTMLKRWGQNDKATIGGDFEEYDRKLFYGATNLWGMNKDTVGTDYGGFGVAVFDPIEDAHSIFASNKDQTTYPDASGVGRTYTVDDVHFWQGHLFAAVRGHGNFRTKISYRDYVIGTAEYDTTKQSASGQANAGFLTSSNYDAGTPGLQKLWNDIIVTGYFPTGTSGQLYYSVNDGVSWVLAGTITGDGSPEKRERFYLSQLKSHQLKYRLELDSSAGAVTPVVTGVTVAYLPLPEPNWVWDVTVNLYERQVLMDRTEEVVDTEALIAQVATWYRDQTILNFTDIDGVSWPNGVIIWDFTDDYHVEANKEDPREGMFRITLLEVQKAAP